MDHVALLQSLPPETRARLTTRSDAAGLAHLGEYLALLALCSTAIILRVPFWPLLMVPQGILLVFLFTLSHECTHRTPFRTRWINDVAGHVIAPVVCLPFLWFRSFHLAHHKFTNDPVRDPELARHPKPRTWRDWAMYLSGLPYWFGGLKTLWTNAFGRISAPYLPPRRHPAMRREARIILAVYGVAVPSLFASPVLLWLWLVPLLVGQPFLRGYLLAEHGLCPPVADMLENSRTTLTNRLIRFLAWNMPYHAEHHSLPDAPFHHLPALHREMAAHLKSTSPGYVSFNVHYARTLAPDT